MSSGSVVLVVPIGTAAATLIPDREQLAQCEPIAMLEVVGLADVDFSTKIGGPEDTLKKLTSRWFHQAQKKK